MIYLATWECDESRPPREERQRPLVVSLSQRVPCSHDPPRARAPVLGACRRRCEPRRLRVHAKPLRSGIASDRTRAGARSHPDGDERAPARQAGAWPPRPSGRIPRARRRAAHPRLELSCSAQPAPATRGSPSTGSPHGYGPMAPGWHTWHLPTDSLIPLRIEARTARDSATVVYPVRRAVPDAGRVVVGSVWLDYPVARADREALALAGRIPRPHRPRERRRRGPAAARGRNRRAPHTAAGVARGARGSAGLRARQHAPPDPHRPRPLSWACCEGEPLGPDPGPMLPLPFTRHLAATRPGRPSRRSRRRHRTGPVAAPDGDARQSADRSRAGRRHDESRAAGQPDRRSRLAGRYLLLVLPDRHPRGRHRPAERRLRLRLSAEAEAWIPVGRSAPASARAGRLRRRRRLGQRHLHAGPRHGAHSAQPAGAVPRRRGRAVAPRPRVRRDGRRRLDALRCRRFTHPADELVAGDDRRGRARLSSWPGRSGATARAGIAPTCCSTFGVRRPSTRATRCEAG